jgi:hypothetical protein
MTPLVKFWVHPDELRGHQVTHRHKPFYQVADVEARDREIVLALKSQGPLWEEWKNGEGSKHWMYKDWIRKRLLAQMEGEP